MVTLISYACILAGMIRVQFFFVSGSLPIEKPDFWVGCYLCLLCVLAWTVKW